MSFISDLCNFCLETFNFWVTWKTKYFNKPTIEGSITRIIVAPTMGGPANVNQYIPKGCITESQSEVYIPIALAREYTFLLTITMYTNFYVKMVAVDFIYSEYKIKLTKVLKKREIEMMQISIVDFRDLLVRKIFSNNFIIVFCKMRLEITMMIAPIRVLL